MSGQDRKVAIITGGSQGIGAGLVAGYRQNEWAVVATSRTITPTADPALLTIAGDVSDPATADRTVGEALKAFGRIDTLVDNAGVYISKPFIDYTSEGWGGEVAAMSSTSPPPLSTLPNPRRPLLSPH